MRVLVYAVMSLTETILSRTPASLCYENRLIKVVMCLTLIGMMRFASDSQSNHFSGTFLFEADSPAGPFLMEEMLRPNSDDSGARDASLSWQMRTDVRIITVLFQRSHLGYFVLT